MNLPFTLFALSEFRLEEAPASISFLYFYRRGMLGLWARSCTRPATSASLVAAFRSSTATTTAVLSLRVGLGPRTSRTSTKLVASGAISSGRTYATSTSPAPASRPPPDAIPATPLKESRWERLSQAFRKDKTGSSSFRKIVSLARPEKKPLLIAVGLLFVSSAVSMSVPFTIGKLIDFFSSTNPVSLSKIPSYMI